MNNKEIPLGEKEFLTVKEAAAYFNIGINKIREITDDDDCKCVLWVGRKRMIKRERFRKFLEESFSV